MAPAYIPGAGTTHTDTHRQTASRRSAETRPTLPPGRRYLIDGGSLCPGIPLTSHGVTRRWPTSDRLCPGHRTVHRVPQLARRAGAARCAGARAAAARSLQHGRHLARTAETQQAPPAPRMRTGSEPFDRWRHGSVRARPAAVHCMAGERSRSDSPARMPDTAGHSRQSPQLRTRQSQPCRVTSDIQARPNGEDQVRSLGRRSLRVTLRVAGQCSHMKRSGTQRTLSSAS